MLDDALATTFADDGPLARSVSGYRPRQAQLALAQAIEQAVHDRSVLIAEAGTGTGKTWAYLVPAFLSGAKVLVSTGTRTLQDQLYRRDLPRLREALALPVAAALLKGRSNYVCHYHLERLQDDDRALKSRQEVAQLRHIQVFASQSQSGDKAELTQVPDNADIWNRVVSTRDNCLGQTCPHLKSCFVYKARRQAQEADVIVVNHALFMADLALRDEGITDLLPEVQLVVFDEAHQLPDIATRFLGSSVSSNQLLELARQVEAVGLAQAREATDWPQWHVKIQQATCELRLRVDPVDRLPAKRATYESMPSAESVHEGLTQLHEVLAACNERLAVVAEKHPDLQTVHRTCTDLAARLFQWARAAANAGSAQEPITTPLVRWVETSPQHFRLHSAPLSVAQLFSRFRRPDQSWVFTSATLSVNGDFSYFQRQLGLYDAATERWESPFDYATQGMLFVPSSLPLPNSPAFTEQFVQQLVPLIEASPGGVLVLCTTLRAVDRITELLKEAFDERGIDRLLMQQGVGSRRGLLERFQASKNAVLVGSASFWEGIDVPGEALTLVAIDKLPFAPPDDPVLEARLNACREEGGNPFMEYQLPEAAVALKQGAGRLIRSESDWGVLMVADRRLVDKPYGKLLWRGLPPFARTRDPEQVLVFMAKQHCAEIN